MSKDLALFCAVLLLASCSSTLRADDSHTSSNIESLEAAQVRIKQLEADLDYFQSISTAEAPLGCVGSTCDSGCVSACGAGREKANWFDSTSSGPTVAAFVAGDSWRDASEFSWPNNFGGRLGIDATWGLGDSGVNASLGAAYGLYDLHGRLTANGSSTEQQLFLTAGLFHRANGQCGDVWTWGASYDYLHDNNYGVVAEAIDLHQIRFMFGRTLNPRNEIGIWGAVGVSDDDYQGVFFGSGSKVESQDQINLYWRRYYSMGGETMLYAGLADPNFTVDGNGNSSVNEDDDLREIVLGLRGTAPLTSNLGLFGGVHYVIPSASGGDMDEENWNTVFGIMWVHGSNLPLLPTADNGWFGKRWKSPRRFL